MDGAVLRIDPDEYRILSRYLLPRDAVIEEAAFAFASIDEVGAGIRFTCKEWYFVPSEAHLSRSRGYIELGDGVRARIIKRAHDLSLSIVEFHSHPFWGTAAFSHTDLEGLMEFVPHTRWRLGGRPYGAIVVSPTGFDGLAWVSRGTDACLLGSIAVGDTIIQASRLSLEKWRMGSGS